jgi:hypothetical protein
VRRRTETDLRSCRFLARFSCLTAPTQPRRHRRLNTLPIAINDAERRYGQALDAFIQFSRRRAGDPDRVAAVIERALTTSRPRARYLVGTDARTIMTLSRFLPARPMDPLLSRAVGMPRRTSDR